MSNKDWNQIRCFILDMDGTIYLGNRLFPFIPAFLEAVRASGREYCFFTNNSSKNAEFYREKLRRMGIDAPLERMLTANQVLIEHLVSAHPGKRVYVMGTEHLVEDFRRAGIRLDDENPEIVVIGFDMSLTYEKLARACRFVREGCVYYGVNMDYNCPVEGGGFLPDCGSMARLIEASTGRMPEFFGKPSRRTLDFLCRATGCAEHELAVVGDRLYTDIALAQDTQAASILVLSGESTRAQAEAGPVHPDWIFDSLEDVTGLL